MSAITGIFYRDGRKVDPELIKKMNNKLSHRGPDGSAVWCDGSIALGHQMLWTTPESLHEKLPFEDEDSGLVITADARIDNRDELSKELDIEDKEEVSDSYFILKAYSRWGENCPEYLLGDFAFAIWDKNKEKLFCARDHMGVKPFYYYLDDDAIFFATEIKALLCVSEIPHKLNKLKLAFHLINIRDKKLTFYKDILSLTAAHFMIINHQRSNINKYWKLNPKSNIIMDSEEEYIQKFLKIFTEAVTCRLRSTFPIGFELSGGLDSSSIVCTAKICNNHHLNKINTFSFIFNDFPDCDERYYIQKIVDTGGIEPHFITVDNISPLEEMETILKYQDQPFFPPNTTISWNLYKKMHENGMRIFLSGHDGDNVVSYGQKYLKELAVTLQWKRLIVEIRAISKIMDRHFYSILLEQVVFPLIPEYLKKKLRSYQPRKKPDTFILDETFAKKMNIEKYFKDLYLEPIRQANTPKKFHHFLIDTISHQYTLEIVDSNAAAFSMEPRYPFYDKRLIEFCYAIPTEMKFKLGWGRYILRISMDNILPDEIQWRLLKPDLNPVFQRNLLLFEKNRLEKILYENNSIIKDYVDINKLQNAYQKYKSENKDPDLHGDSLDTWLVSLLYLWLYETGIN